MSRQTHPVNPRGKALLALSLCLLIVLPALAACDPDQQQAGLTPIATRSASATPRATATPASTPTPTLTPSPTLTPTPRMVDYAPMIAQIKEYVKTSGIGPKFDMSVGFVDVQSGQSADFDGKTRHFALSTFKGPLGAYYFWLVEQGKLSPQQSDLDFLQPMMSKSDNEATTCTFRRVGGLAGFNDWLAAQGLGRQNNFVAQWQNWACTADKQVYILPTDQRYMRGDKTLGLPGGYTLDLCYPGQFLCYEAFSPVELAGLYAKLYKGDVLNATNTQQWLSLMKKDSADVALIKSLGPADKARVTAYVKNGFSAKNDEFTVNFQHEAGIIVTPYGVYTLAVFTQGDPDWPGNEPLGRVGRIVYDYFMVAHGAGE